MGLHRLLHELDVEPLVLEEPDGADRLLGRPPLVGVHPEQNVLPHRRTDLPEADHVLGRVGPHLDLQGGIPVRHGLEAVFHHGFRIVDADGVVCLHFLRRSPEEGVQRLPENLSPQVVEGDVYRGLCRRVVHQCRIHDVQQIVEVFRILPGEERTKPLLHRTTDRSVGIPRNDRRGRGFSVPADSFIRLHDHHVGGHFSDRPERRLERLFQRNGKTSETECAYFHSRLPPSWTASWRRRVLPRCPPRSP